MGTEQITNLSGWDRALRANQGKPVQITILRDRKQQIITLQVDSKHRQGALVAPVGFTADDSHAMAEINEELAENSAATAEEWRRQAQDSRASSMELKIDPKQMVRFRHELDELRDQINSGKFNLSRKQTDQLELQMDMLERQIDRQLRSSRDGDYV